MENRTPKTITEGKKAQRSAYEALRFERAHDENFDPEHIGLAGLVPIYSTPERVSYN